MQCDCVYTMSKVVLCVSVQSPPGLLDVTSVFSVYSVYSGLDQDW